MPYPELRNTHRAWVEEDIPLLKSETEKIIDRWSEGYEETRQTPKV